MTRNTGEKTTTRAYGSGRPRRSKGDGGLYFDAANGVWVGCVDLGRDAAGKRRRAKVHGRTKTAALTKLRDLRNRADRGEIVTHDRMTVEQAVADWISRGMKADLASNTRYLNTLMANYFAESCGARALPRLTVRDVEDYLARLAAEGKATRTLRVARSVAERVLDHAARQGWVTPGRNVARLAQVPQGAEPAERPQLTDDDIRALLAAAEGDRWMPLLATVAVTGCRVGEAVALAWSDVDVEKNVISILAAARREADGAGVTRRDPKKGSKRAVEVPPDLIRLLVAHRRFCVEESVLLGLPVPDLAFPTSAGTMPDRRNIDRWLDKVAESANVTVKGWHDLRHALATGLADDGVPVTRNAAVLGHRNVTTTTGVYTHAPRGVADAAVGRGRRLLVG